MKIFKEKIHSVFLSQTFQLNILTLFDISMHKFKFIYNTKNFIPIHKLKIKLKLIYWEKKYFSILEKK